MGQSRSEVEKHPKQENWVPNVVTCHAGGPQIISQNSRGFTTHWKKRVGLSLLPALVPNRACGARGHVGTRTPDTVLGVSDASA